MSIAGICCGTMARRSALTARAQSLTHDSSPHAAEREVRQEDALICDMGTGDACHRSGRWRWSISHLPGACRMSDRHCDRLLVSTSLPSRRCLLTFIHPCCRRVIATRSCPQRPGMTRMMSDVMFVSIAAIGEACKHRFSHVWYIGACRRCPPWWLAGHTAGQCDVCTGRTGHDSDVL